MSNATTFGRQAKAYAKGRPGYPSALYEWIAANSTNTDHVWDVGTGSGQAARDLTAYFSHIHATDLSPEQIAAAEPHPQIDYHAMPAHCSGLAENSVDAITVATAVHWFASSDFWDEVKRAARPGGLFCAWTYQLPQSSSAVNTAFLHPIYTLIDPFWADGNRFCMAGYSADNLNWPFPTLKTPEFNANGIWSAQQLVDFAQSWSAHLRARDAGLSRELERLTTAFLKDFADQPIEFDMPISLLAARLP